MKVDIRRGITATGEGGKNKIPMNGGRSSGNT